MTRAFNTAILREMEAEGFTTSPHTLGHAYESLRIIEKYWGNSQPPIECSMTLSHSLMLDLIATVIELEEALERITPDEQDVP